ncbi:HlyD family type I secretion periplasmic adaptor subunit, partial [Asaia sp. As-1742]|nr:HlyD family type I secretion periplasmic adaptor subunit [Asaia sp. As-1742]
MPCRAASMRSGEGKAALSDVMPIARGRRRGWFSRLIAQDDDAYAFLPVALEIVERPAPPLPRAIALTICAACTVGLIWASIGEVEIVANAPGVIVPIGKAKIVQAVSTANIDVILVEDGQHVMAGQTLIRLDPVSAYASRDKSLTDLHASRLDVAGLSALSDKLAEPDLDLSFVAPTGSDPLSAREALAAIRARAADQARKLASLSAQIAEKRAEILEGQDTLAKLSADLPMLASVRDMYARLDKEHLASRLNVVQSLQHYTDTKNDLEIQSAHRDEAVAAVADLRHQYEAQHAVYAHDVLKDLAEARRKLAENEASYRAAAHEAADTDLRAPVSGIVQQLSVHSVRGVVTAGDRLMVIVPDDGKLDVEAEITNRDIGFVSEGQKVQVKVA